MLRYLIYILLVVCFFSRAGYAQEERCAYENGLGYNQFNIPWDNYLLVSFTNVDIKEESGTKYLYFNLNFRRKGEWYPASTLSIEDIELDGEDPVVQGVNLYFDFNTSVLEGEKTGSIEMVECTQIKQGSSYYPLTDDKNCYQMSCEVSTVYGGRKLGAINMALRAAAARHRFFVISKTEDFYCATYRWKIKPGATGLTGVKLKVGKGLTTEFYSLAKNDKSMTDLGICTTGNLNISVGGNTPKAPVINSLTGDALACQGEEKSYTATVDDASATLSWRVKSAANADITATAVEGGAIASTTNQATFTWATTAPIGTDSVCLTATKDGLTAEKCIAVSVKAAPTLALNASSEAECAGEPITLTATSGLTSYQWYQGSTLLATTGTATYSPTLPTSGSTVEYSVKATKDGCTATAQKTITLNPLPKAEINVEIANGHTRASGKYAKGDRIVYTAVTPNTALYNYSWSDGVNTSSGTEFEIPSATANAYNVTLTVEDKTTHCSATKTVNLTLDGSCGITNLALSGTNGNLICQNGLSRITATVTTVCDGSEVIGYALYKGNVKLDSVGITNNAKSHIFNVFEAGTFTVKVYTFAGMLTSDITISIRNVQTDKVSAPDYLYVRSGHSTILIANSTNGTINQWLWEPKEKISGDNARQYARTSDLSVPTTYYVYGTDQNECMSVDSTKVEISNEALIVEVTPEAKTICKKGSVTLTANVIGGVGPYTYEWTHDSYTENGDYTHQSTRFKDAGSAHAGTTYDRVVLIRDNSTPALTGVAMASINVAATEEPQLRIDGNNPLCQDGKLTITKIGGATPASYTWYIKPQSGNMITAVGSSYTFSNRGDYQVWVQGNTAACSSDTAKATLNLKVNGFDLAWTTEPANYQLGADITATAQATEGTGPYTFTWDNLIGGAMTGAATANPNTYKVLGASESNYTFKVSVQDANGCQKTLEKPVSASISGGLQLVVNGSTTQCQNGAIALTASASGGSSPYTFRWYAPGNEAAPYQTTVATGLSDLFVRGGFNNNDKIVVKVSDNSGLSRYDTLPVTTSLNVAPTVSAGDDITIAANTPTILMGEVVSGTVNAWHWNPVGDLASESESTKQYATTKNITALKTFTVYATNSDGCVSIPDDIVVNVSTTNTFAVTIQDPGTLCIGNEVQLAATLNPASVTVDSWEWDETSGHLTNTTTSSPTFAAAVSDNSNVYLRVTATIGGETMTATASRGLTVQNYTAPTIALEGLAADGSICSKETLKVVSTDVPAITLTTCKWYLGGVLQSATGTTFKPEANGTTVAYVKVTAQSNVGCPAVNEVGKDITINPKPKLEWDASSVATVAAGADVKMQANLVGNGNTPDYTYAWDHSGSTSGIVFTDLPAGASSQTFATSQATTPAAAGKAYKFKVYVTDGKGCKSTPIEKTVSVSGDILTVNLTTQPEGFCVGGAALLKAEVVNAAPDITYTYAWTEDGAPVTGVSGSEYLIQSPVAGKSYTVTVTGGGKTGTSAPLTLVAASPAVTASTLSAIDQQIPVGTRTVLVATPSAGVKITEWQWNPVDKIATGESKSPHPYTTLLDGPRDHTFTVYAIDENGCVTKPLNVKVSTINNTPAPGDDAELFAKVIPEEITICSGNELELQTRVWNNSSSQSIFTWEPASHLSATNIADPVFNDSHAFLAPGTYSYVVKVQRGVLLTYARTKIHVVNGTLPVLALDTDQSGNACAGGNIVMKVNNASAVTINKYIWFIDGVEDPSVTGNTYTWPAVTGESQHTVKVVAVTSGQCRSNTVEMDSLVKPAAELKDLARIDSCGQVILFAKSDAVATYTWEITAGADKLGKRPGVSADTLYLTPLANLTTTSLPYTVNVTVQPQNGGCQAKGQISGKLFFQPKVVLEEWTPDGEALSLPYRMAEKNTTFQIPVNEPASDYTATNADYSWITLAGGTLNTTPTQATFVNITADDTVKITVTNKEAATCQASDSMPVYLYPEAPTLTIDTVDNSFVKAALYLSGGDNYTIWSRKWDPYCQTTAFTGNQVYEKELTGTNITSSLWKEPDMDTLEYYYATSGRTIQGRTWNSKTTSDTVGYYLFDVNYNAQLANDNYMPIYFDFAAMDCPTTVDLALRLKSTCNVASFMISRFIYATQKTLSTTVITANPMLSNATKFNLTQDLRAIAIRPSGNVKAQFLQYGKLPSTDFAVKGTNAAGNINWGYALPQKAGNLVSFNSLGGDIKTQVMRITVWIFSLQKTVSLTVLPNGNVTGVSSSVPSLRPLLFLKMEPRTKGGTYIWK